MATVSDYTALLSTSTWTAGALGTPAVVTYSFESLPQPYLSAHGYSANFINSFQAFSGAQRTEARAAFDLLSEASGLIFVEVPAGFGDIRFANYNFDYSSNYTQFAGLGFWPWRWITSTSSHDELYGGDVFVNTQKSFPSGLMHHEIGHAIGLKHPFEGDPVLAAHLDHVDYTVMSYDGWTRGVAQAYGPLDLQAAAHLYGPAIRAGGTLLSWDYDATTMTLSQQWGAANSTIAGTNVRDVIHGGGGNDTIAGFNGNDVLAGDEGADHLDGGPGSDTVDYSGSNAGVAFNLTAGSPIGGHAAADRLISIENVIGSNFNDGIGGNAANNILNGGPGNDAMTGVAGNDTLLGGAGNDLLVGSHGHDTINGGPGNDFASYANALTGVIVSLLSGKGFGGHAAGDMLISIEHLAGWHFDDNLTGNAFGNIVDGKGGNDILHGAAGNDNVIGGDGNDWVYGDGGADILEGRSGNDVLVGGALFDFFRYRQADFGRDHILDYQDGLDQIWLTGSGLTFADFTVAQAGAHTVLTLDADNSIMLHNTNAALIDSDDFIV